MNHISITLSWRGKKKEKKRDREKHESAKLRISWDY